MHQWQREMASRSRRALKLLDAMPFLVPFQIRLAVFREQLQREIRQYCRDPNTELSYNILSSHQGVVAFSKFSWWQCSSRHCNSPFPLGGRCALARQPTRRLLSRQRQGSIHRRRRRGTLHTHFIHCYLRWIHCSWKTELISAVC